VIEEASHMDEGRQSADANPGAPGLSRRQIMGMTAATVAGLLARGAPLARAAEPVPVSRRTPDEVLRSLLDGNQRFVRGQPEGPRRRPEDFASLAEGQHPNAVIVSCADSRVPPEIVFDQGVGDLFVVRIAGNVVASAGVLVKGSIEYGVAELGASLVMVLGHTACGALKAAIKHIEDHDTLPGSIGGLVATLKPVVAKIKGRPGDLLDQAIRANVEAGVARLKALSPIVAPAVRAGRVKVVGGVYDLKTGIASVIV
jgi:carbonic anhydrase